MEGCKKNSVRYIAPQLEDSVDETLRRKYTLNVKIKSSKCIERRRKKREERQELAVDSTRCNICFGWYGDMSTTVSSLVHTCRRGHRFHIRCWANRQYLLNASEESHQTCLRMAARQEIKRITEHKSSDPCPTCDKIYPTTWSEGVEETTGKKYYRNKKTRWSKTKMVTWEKPAGFGTTGKHWELCRAANTYRCQHYSSSRFIADFVYFHWRRRKKIVVIS